MRLHEREQPTNIAESALALAIYDELEKHDLTEAETLRVLHGAYSSVLNGIIKVAIRVERHGDPEALGGAAEG